MYSRSNHRENDPVPSVLAPGVVMTLCPGLLPLAPRVRAGESVSARALRDHCPDQRTQTWSPVASEEEVLFSGSLRKRRARLQHWSP